MTNLILGRVRLMGGKEFQLEVVAVHKNKNGVKG